jgi:hypothetical protein
MKYYLPMVAVLFGVSLAGCGGIAALDDSIGAAGNAIANGETPKATPTPDAKDDSVFVGNWIDSNGNNFQFNSGGPGSYNGNTIAWAVYTENSTASVTITPDSGEPYKCMFSNTNVYGSQAFPDLLTSSTLFLSCDNASDYTLSEVMPLNTNPFPSADPFVSVAEGDFYCVVDISSGQVGCNLAGGEYQLVSGLSGATAILNGDETHFCASTTSGHTYCWGHDMDAQEQ